MNFPSINIHIWHLFIILIYLPLQYMTWRLVVKILSYNICAAYRVWRISHASFVNSRTREMMLDESATTIKGKYNYLQCACVFINYDARFAVFWCNWDNNLLLSDVFRLIVFQCIFSKQRNTVAFHISTEPQTQYTCVYFILYLLFSHVKFLFFIFFFYHKRTRIIISL